MTTSDAAAARLTICAITNDIGEYITRIIRRKQVSVWQRLYTGVGL